MFEDILGKDKDKDRVIHCAGGCGRSEEFKSEFAKDVVKWTCIDCCDTEFGAFKITLKWNVFERSRNHVR